MSKEKLWLLNIALICRWATAALEVKQNHVLINSHHRNSKNRHTKLFHEFSAEAHYRLFHRNKREFASHNGSYIFCEVTQHRRSQLDEGVGVESHE